jgi:hypothetical protein
MKNSLTSCPKGGTPKGYQAFFWGGFKFKPHTHIFTKKKLTVMRAHTKITYLITNYFFRKSDL